MIGVLLLTAILAGALHESQGDLTVDFECNPYEIVIIVNEANLFLSTNTGPCIVSDAAISVPYGSGYKITISCPVALNDPMAFFIHPQGMVMGKSYVNVTCKPDTMATAGITDLGLSTPDHFDHTAMDILDALVIITGVSSSYVLDYEDIISITADFADSAFDNYYDFAVQHIVIYNGGAYKYLVQDGCILVSGVNISPQSGNELDIDIPVLVPVDASNGVLSPITIDIYFKFYICLDGDTTCGDCVGSRKRRQVDDQTTSQNLRQANTTSRTMLFLDQEEQDKFIDKMMSAYAAGTPLGRTDNALQQSMNDICMNKTVTSIIVVLILIGMVLCFLATIWMCYRLKKSRRIDESVKSDYAYSNRSFSKALESVKPVV